MKDQHNETESELAKKIVSTSRAALWKKLGIVTTVAAGIAPFGGTIFNQLMVLTTENLALSSGIALLGGGAAVLTVSEGLARFSGLGSLAAEFKGKAKPKSHSGKIEEKELVNLRDNAHDAPNRGEIRAQILHQIIAAISHQSGEKIKSSIISIYSGQLNANLRRSQLLSDEEKKILRNEMQRIQVKHDNTREKNPKAMLKEQLLAFYQPLSPEEGRAYSTDALNAQREDLLVLLKNEIKNAKITGIDKNNVIRVKNELETLINSHIVYCNSPPNFSEQQANYDKQGSLIQNLTSILGDIKQKYAANDEYRTALSGNMKISIDKFQQAIQNIDIKQAPESLQSFQRTLEQAEARLQGYQERFGVANSGQTHQERVAAGQGAAGGSAKPHEGEGQFRR